MPIRKLVEVFESIEIDGSSTVYPMTKAAADEYQASHPEINLSPTFSGTGGGFQKFCAGETDINGASRPISTEELEACRTAGVRFIELPIAFDALTVVVNPQNNWVESLTVDELKRIWEPAAQGQITNWNQVRPEFPNQPFQLFGAGTDSGTYDYFNALGFFGFSYYEQNQEQLKAVAIDDGDGATLLTREAVENSTYQPLSRPLFIYVNIQSA